MFLPYNAMITSKFIWMIGIITLIAIAGCTQSIPGAVSNPKQPSLAKPSDMFHCEVNDDCTTTIYKEDTCCLFCEYAVNNDAGNYLSGWNELNCNNPKSRDGCVVFECMRVSEVRCKDNKCVVNYDRS
jgi:hypothetical protein